MVSTRRTPRKDRSPSPAPLPDGGSSRRRSTRKSTPSRKKRLNREQEVAAGGRSPSPSPRSRPTSTPPPEAVDGWKTEWSEKFGEWYWWHKETMQVSWHFPDGSAPDQDELRQNQQIMEQTQPTEGEEEGGGGSSAGASEQRARLLLLFVLALAYLANEYSKGRLPWVEGVVGELLSEFDRSSDKLL